MYYFDYKPVTPREKVLRCVTLQMQTICEKRKARLELIKENIIEKENNRITKWLSQEKTQEMLKDRYDITKKFLKI